MLIPLCVKRHVHDESLNSSKYASTLNASQCKENPESNNLYDQFIHLNMKDDCLLNTSEKSKEIVQSIKQQVIIPNHITSLTKEVKKVKEVQTYKTEDTSINLESFTNELNIQTVLNKTLNDPPSIAKNTSNKQDFDNNSSSYSIELNLKPAINKDHRNTTDKCDKSMKTIFIDIKYSPSNRKNIHIDIKCASGKQRSNVSSMTKPNKKFNISSTK